MQDSLFAGPAQQGAATALVAVLICAPAIAQAPEWTPVSTSGPTARAGPAMAYDGQRQRVVLYGGSNNGYFDDTWQWDGSTWTQVSSSGPPRTNCAMAYDSQRQRIVLFGGSDGSPSPLHDTWEWDGGTWTQVSSSGPGFRESHAMAYDSQRQRTVLFGGIVTYPYWGDTWEWDGSTWVQVSASGPAARWGHAMAYDSMRGRTVLFGGDSNGYLGDTWEWDGSTWSQASSTGPPARIYPAMVYDSRRGKTVLFGGRHGSSSASVFGDTWEWDGGTWVQVSASGPAARYHHAMAYDSVRDKAVLFGGRSGTVRLGDTWEWDGILHAAAATYGAGCGVPPLMLSPIAGARPILGTSAMATVSNTPSPLTVGAIGLSNTSIGTTPLPMSLAYAGMPGCELLQSLDLGGWWPTVNSGPGTADFSFAIPASPMLLGQRLFVQACTLVPGATPVVSNGVEWLIGHP